jgi:hypothetical protein
MKIAKGLGMNANHVEHLEFIGGPEDGLVVDSAFLPFLMVTEDEDGSPEIPMFIRLEKDLTVEEGRNAKLVLIGQYVCDDPGRERLKYLWVG